MANPEIFSGDGGGSAHDDAAQDRMLELTDVARPAVGTERRARAAVKAIERA